SSDPCLTNLPDDRRCAVTMHGDSMHDLPRHVGISKQRSQHGFPCFGRVSGGRKMLFKPRPPRRVKNQTFYLSPPQGEYRGRERPNAVPSLRTVRAVLPHTALQSVVLLIGSVSHAGRLY